MISEPLIATSATTSSDAELSKFLENSPGIVFLADPNEPFYSKSHPFVNLISLEDILEEDEELDEQHCHACQKIFANDCIWFMENAPENYCLLCLDCIRDLLVDREVFATSIYPYQFQDWTAATPRPSAVSFTRFHWEAISYVNGKGAEIVSCWNCGNTGKTVDLETPHWELTLSKGSTDAHGVQICNGCADNCALLIPAPEIAVLL